MKSILRKKPRNSKIKKLLIFLVITLSIINLFLYKKIFTTALSYFTSNLKSPIVINEKFQLEDILNKYDLRIEGINNQNDDIILFFPGGIQAILKKDNLSQQVASLQLILKRSKIEGRKVQLIDLRYNKPIIK